MADDTGKKKMADDKKRMANDTGKKRMADDKKRMADENSFLTFAAVAIVAGISASAGTLLTQAFTSKEAIKYTTKTNTVQLLFSTPVYYANVTKNVDVRSLATLALEGYTHVRHDADLLQQMRILKMHECTRDSGDEKLCKKYLSDTWMDILTYNDAFFTWQMEQGENGVPAWTGMPPNMAFGIKRGATGYHYVRAFSRAS